MLKLENEQVYFEVKTQAAEMISFKDKVTGIEYLWQGDPAFWAGRNPILFPMVGSTWDKIVRINGKEYTMGNHGFARNSDFAVASHTEDEIILTLSDNEETRSQYPFRFTLSVSYKLSGKDLTITYRIENHSNEVMPFNFGLHPAFNCPLEKDEQFSDYHLEFSGPETVKTLKGDFSLNQEKNIPLSYEQFDKIPTLLFENIASPFVSLTNGRHGVKVGITGYRWLAFWTKSQAPYLCIEPWHSHGDFGKTEVPFEEREGTLLLDANKSYTTAYSVSIF